MNTTNYQKFIKLPIIGKIIQENNRDLKNHSIKYALGKIATKTNTKIEIKHDNQETLKILNNQSAIIIFNHPYEIEAMIVLGSLPERKDIFIIMTANFLGKIPNFDKYILPVYVDHNAKIDKQGKLSGKILKFLGKRKGLEPQKARELNKKTIIQAAQKIKTGSLVAICPEGYRGVNGKWFDGVGYLINQIGPSQEAYLINAYISGTSNLDWFRLIPFINKLLPKLEIIFSSPQKISSIININSKPKDIKNRLENDYKTWSETIQL